MKSLNSEGIKVSGIVCNQVISETSDEVYLQNRVKSQHDCITRLTATTDSSGSGGNGSGRHDLDFADPNNLSGDWCPDRLNSDRYISADLLESALPWANLSPGESNCFFLSLV